MDVNRRMLGNSTAESSAFSNQISKKFDMLFAEGMKEDDFIEARENLAFLEMEYFDVLFEGSTNDAQKNDIYSKWMEAMSVSYGPL